MKISISDTGVGIADEDRSRIFSKFFKGKNNYNREGLGLFIVKKMVDLHAGAKYYDRKRRQSERHQGCFKIFDGEEGKF